MFIYWTNISTVMTDADVAAIMNAVRIQVNQHVAPAWSTGGIWLEREPKGQGMPARGWQFVIADTSDQAGAAGYHETTAAGLPIGYAFVKTTRDAGMHASVTISHEIVEMVGDPLIDQLCIWSDLPNAVMLAQELCDPPEDDRFGYEINGVLVSDFVTPAYFVPGSAGPWDYKGHLAGPWDRKQMLPGAYQSTWDPQAGWQQVFPETHGRMGRAVLQSPFSRRVRRVKPKRQWARSAH